MTNDDRVLLRLSDVSRMEAQLAECERQVKELTKQRDALIERVSAARYFLNLVSEPAAASEETAVTDEPDMTQETKRIVCSAPRPLDHDEVRAELAKFTALDKRLRETPNYYYTVVHRLIKRNEIIREGRKLRAPTPGEVNKPQLVEIPGVNPGRISEIARSM